jgi:hypothetical protein
MHLYSNRHKIYIVGRFRGSIYTQIHFKEQFSCIYLARISLVRDLCTKLRSEGRLHFSDGPCKSNYNESILLAL